MDKNEHPNLPDRAVASPDYENLSVSGLRFAALNPDLSPEERRAVEYLANQEALPTYLQGKIKSLYEIKLWSKLYNRLDDEQARRKVLREIAIATNFDAQGNPVGEGVNNTNPAQVSPEAAAAMVTFASEDPNKPH